MKLKIIQIKDEDDPRLLNLQSQGWKIEQISFSGIYLWVLLTLNKHHNDSIQQKENAFSNKRD